MKPRSPSRTHGDTNSRHIPTINTPSAVAEVAFPVSHLLKQFIIAKTVIRVLRNSTLRVSTQDTRENALARFSHPPTADEQGFWSGYFVYKGVCYMKWWSWRRAAGIRGT